MTELLVQQEVSQRTWQWPIQLDIYDRSPVLSFAEKEALQHLSQLAQRKNTHDQQPLHLALNRIIRPLGDVLAFAQVGVDRWHPTLNALLQHMLWRDKTFWGWTAAEWEDTLTQKLIDRHRYPASTVAYLLCSIRDLRVLQLKIPTFTNQVFGEELVNRVVDDLATILQQWGYRGKTKAVYSGICRALLANGSPYLKDLTYDVMARIQASNISAHDGWVIGTLSRALVGLGYLQIPLPSRPVNDQQIIHAKTHEGIAPEWAAVCRRWHETSTFETKTRQNLSRKLLRIGRWLGQTHPEVVHPRQWTRQLAAEFVAAVNQMQSGDWCNERQPVTYRGKPMSAAGKNAFLHAARAFFRDCQEWEWIPVRFNPAQCFQTPRAILSAIGPRPRVIADDIWAKLLYAGLNLTTDDLPRNLPAKTSTRYPLEMVRAIAMVWLFSGLRSDEIRRLRVGCIRWQLTDTAVNSVQAPTKDAVCLLDVPVNKTGSAFTKPVDYCIGEAIDAWEKMRPM